MSNKRTGKIASLPHEVREQVNERLRDGAKYPAIIKWLESQGVRGVQEMNLTNWFQGGYQDWLKDRQLADQVGARAKASLDLVRELKAAGDVHITEANELILASQINEALQAFDGKGLSDLLAEKPKEFFNLAASVIGQSSERTKREKLELELKKYQDAVSKAREEIQKLRDPKEELDDSERNSIIDKVDEILGIK